MKRRIISLRRGRQTKGARPIARATLSSMKRVQGMCIEEDWGHYAVTLQTDRKSFIALDAPALARLTGGRPVLNFRARATRVGWTLWNPHNRDWITLNKEMTEGVYRYKDGTFADLNIKWNLDLNLKALHVRFLAVSFASEGKAEAQSE